MEQVPAWMEQVQTRTQMEQVKGWMEQVPF